MDIGGLQIDPDQLIEIATAVGGVGLTGLFGYLVVKRARAARQRQIDGIGGAEASLPSAARRHGRSRTALAPEPEEDLDEAPGEAADESAGEAAEIPSLRLQPAVEPARKQAPAPTPAPDLRDRPDAEVIPFPLPQKPLLEKPRRAPAPEPEVEAAPVPVAKKRDGAALVPGLARTRAGWVARLGAIFSGKKQIDPAVLDEVEKVLLTADIGVRTSSKLLEEMRASLSRAELQDGDAIWGFLRRRSAEILSLPAPAIDWKRARPFVLLIIGVNGSGKTTTIGKLAAKLMADGRKVILGAGDTFRAAAVEQLEIWAGRVGAPVVRGKEGADPSSVLFDAVKKAATDGLDVVIADTAGRLHTKVDLMEELQKVRRVIGKAAPGAPHETWLVIDSTSGQNAIAQAQIFTQAMAVSGIVLTKLDGTAKGGVILGITDQLQIPVRYIGVGERVEDLRAFEPEEFVDALFSREDLA